MKFIYFPGSLKKIKRNLFHWIENVEEIYFGEGIEKIELDAFNKCKKIKYIHFPSTLKIIEATAFGNSPSYLDVYLPSSVIELSFVSFGRNTTIRTSLKYEDIVWDDNWTNNRYNIITEHNDEYFCSKCKGYTNEDYSGTGYKCICQ